MAWSRLIRFLGEDGNVHYGEPVIQEAGDLPKKLENNELRARELSGSSPFELSPTGVDLEVVRLLPVLEPKDAPLVRCIGLNYQKHIAEAGRKPPPYPSLFIKSASCVAGFDEDIPIPRLAQDDQCDYEGELSIVIGKTGKDIAKENTLDYVAGYCASNDVSSRKWQRDPAYAGVVPQWCFSKGFDKYAPLGPMLVSPKVVGAAHNLQLQTFVNGEERQNSNTSDLLFGVREIVAFLSQGTTLQRGEVIMTGTPSGVAMGMKPSPQWLKHGDVVECFKGLWWQHVPLAQNLYGTMMGEQILSGSCLCKGVQFTATGPPEKVMVCYCDDCTRNAGGPCQIVAKYSKSKIEFLEGINLTTTWIIQQTSSGTEKHKVFCKRCGCTLWTIPMAHGAEHLMVRTSVLHQGLDALKPNLEIYAAWRPRYMNPFAGTKRFDGASHC